MSDGGVRRSTGFLEGEMLLEGRQTGADRLERLVVRGEQEVSR